MRPPNYFIIAFIQEHWKSILGVLSIGLCSNVMTLFVPLIITLTYTVLFDISTSKSLIFNQFFLVEPTFPLLLLIFFISILIKGLLDLLLKYGMGKLGEQLIFQIRYQLFEYQLKVQMQEYDKRGMGRYLLRYSGDLSSIHGYLTKGIIRFGVDVILLLVTFVILGIVYPMMSIILLVWLAIMSVLINYLNNIFYTITEQRRNRKSNLLSFVNTRLMSMLTLQTFNKEKPELTKFRKRVTRLNTLGKEYQHLAACIQALVPFVVYGMIGIILLFIFYKKEETNSAIGSELLLLVVLILISLLPVFRRLLNVSMVWKKGKISILKLNNIFQLETNPFENSPNVDIQTQSIAVKNLTFKYGNGVPIFKNLSFVIPANKITLIKGGAGSGKTTLIKLLTAIYYPSKGRITIGEQDSASVNPKSWRKQITIVAEEWQLYGKTVLEAIAYGKSNKYKKRAIRVLKQLQKDTNHTLKIDNSIGDFGAKCSKSERKILLYARALMTRKPILIIDKPFDGIDEAYKPHLIELLQTLKTNHTIVLIDAISPDMVVDHVVTLPVL